MLKNDLKGKNSKLIRGALNKTQFREQSESLFLTSGYLYQSAEQAEATVKVSVLTSVQKLFVCVVNSRIYRIESGPGFISNSKLGIESY